MKLITRNTDYALRAIIYIGKSGKETVSVPELVTALKIPKPFLRKILQILNTKGMLRSSKGKGGGFALARRPETISLIDVLNIFQGPFRLNECIFKKLGCPNRTTCLVKKRIDMIEDGVLRELKSITLKELF